MQPAMMESVTCVTSEKASSMSSTRGERWTCRVIHNSLASNCSSLAVLMSCTGQSEG